MRGRWHYFYFPDKETWTKWLESGFQARARVLLRDSRPAQSHHSGGCWVACNVLGSTENKGGKARCEGRGGGDWNSTRNLELELSDPSQVTHFTQGFQFNSQFAWFCLNQNVIWHLNLNRSRIFIAKLLEPRLGIKGLIPAAGISPQSSRCQCESVVNPGPVTRWR